MLQSDPPSITPGLFERRDRNISAYDLHVGLLRRTTVPTVVDFKGLQSPTNICFFLEAGTTDEGQAKVAEELSGRIYRAACEQLVIEHGTDKDKKYVQDPKARKLFHQFMMPQVIEPDSYHIYVATVGDDWIEQFRAAKMHYEGAGKFKCDGFQNMPNVPQVIYSAGLGTLNTPTPIDAARHIS